MRICDVRRETDLIYPSIIVWTQSSHIKVNAGTYQQFVRGWSNIEYSSPRDYYASPKRPRPSLALETAELNLVHWGDWLHSVLGHFANHFTCSRAERNFFRLRIPATSAYQQVFGIMLEGGGKEAICSANMRDGLRDELFCTRLHSVLEISSLE